jgi:hypothetical protein
LGDVGHVPGLVNIQKIWNITIFNGKTMENSLFLWPFEWKTQLYIYVTWRCRT